MPNRELIVIGASAGGIEALQQAAGDLPADLPAAVLVVLHMPPTGGQALARILDRSTKLEVAVAEDGERLRHGRLYVSPGDSHLLVGRGHIHVRKGPRENGYRPAIDPLFRSAAAYYGPRAIGVVLSGSLHDGTAGLLSIRNRGGVAVVQDPDDAMYDEMPRSALEYVGSDYTVKASEIGALLARLAGEPIDGNDPPVDPLTRREVEIMEGELSSLVGGNPGRPSPWLCPDCSGVLWEIREGPLLRFRCRVGHAWAAEQLLQQQGQEVEAALWMAMRALEDRVSLSRQLAEQAEEAGRRISAGRYRADLGAMERSLTIMKRLLSSEEAGFGMLTRLQEEDQHSG